MLIPHLHFNDNCQDAIIFYEQAFNTKVEEIIFDNDGKVSHATINIHGQKVFLNDRFGKNDTTTNTAIHLIIIFNNTSELKSCYNIMKEDSIIIDQLQALPYSPLAVQFIDKFGVQWGFMVDKKTT